jgi:hypothetical protein
MREIVLIEDGCCRAGELDDFVEFLQERFAGRAEVTKYGVGGHLGFSSIPLELGNRLLSQGAKAVPLIALDGDMLFQGELPDWEDSARAIDERLVARIEPSETAAG